VQLAAAEAALGSAASADAREQAEDAKAKVIARIAELHTQATAAKAGLQPKLDAVTPAREAAVAAENARVVAAEAAREAARELEPVSVFISRKTQRLYIRRAFQPIVESPVTVRDPDRPIGTHVFTAMERVESGTTMRWNVVSLDDGRPPGSAVEPQGGSRSGLSRDAEAKSTGLVGARNALERIIIPPEALDRIAEMASPRSSLIISDEALSPETGNDTDFVVILSGEPQGSLKVRRRVPTEARYLRDRRPYWNSPLAGPYSTW
jgi:hypothetical protein